MMRWRQAVRPPIPTSLENYAQILNDPKWNHLTQYPTGRLNVSAVIGRDSSVAVVIGDPQFLQTIVAEEFYIDATYKVCPRKPKFYQLFTIMAKAIPITWALMDKKTTLAYVTVLEHFKSTLAQHLQPKKFTVDYESGLASAVSLIYPDALICRCYFHYLQALVRRLKSYGKNFMTQLENWEEAQIFVRKIAGLPFLPAHCISEAFEWLINNTTNDLKIFFDPFIEYV
ncbi:GSCOCG00011756001-RA-CDS, partial [Cotesia congregata]